MIKEKNRSFELFKVLFYVCVFFILLGCAEVVLAENSKPTDSGHRNWNKITGGKNNAIFPNGGVSDRILVKFKKGCRNDGTVAMAQFRLEKVKHYTLTDVHVYQIPKNQRQRQGDILRTLRQNAMVEYAEPDFLVKVNLIPNDPDFGLLWGLHNTGQEEGTENADMDAPETWDMTQGNMEVVVAVIDTGVDYTHPDLKDNMWVNENETANDGIDNDGNGYIDDVHGMNAVGMSGDPMDDHYHGTHCAGTIGAVGNNGVGVVGVSPNVRIMALKFLDNSGYGSVSDAITCIEYAIANGAHILNNSWGGGGESEALRDAIKAAQEGGLLFVAAAGNDMMDTDRHTYYPAGYEMENILSVGAMTRYDGKAFFSNYGATTVDVFAPGMDVYSTKPGNTYGYLSGTSMACPHATGLAALLKAFDRTLTAEQIKTIIIETSVPVEKLTNYCVAGGRINGSKALAFAQIPRVTLTNPVSDILVHGTVAVSVTAADDEGVEKVEFYVDGVLRFTDHAGPTWRCNWNSRETTDGMHTIRAVVYDGEGNRSEDVAVFKVHNANTPGLMITSPKANAVPENVVVTLQAALLHGPGIEKAAFLIDGTVVGVVTEAPYKYEWNSFNTADGEHEFRVWVRGKDGQTAQTKQTITLDNCRIPETERNALIAIFDGTGGDDWYRSDEWKRSDGEFNFRGTEKDWFGVTIENDHVTGLNLGLNNLSGSLPTELKALSRLKELHLGYNGLSGSIPKELGALTALEVLKLGGNGLTGAIPSALGNMSRLTLLEVFNNELSGSLPASLGDLGNLNYMDLRNNALSGAIPSELGNLKDLKALLLANNALSGSIPAELGELKDLEQLWLDYNELTGKIPGALGDLTFITSIYLNHNKLSGPIPSELGNLTYLLVLDLRSNKLTGAIPETLSNLGNLSYGYLGIGYNGLHTEDETVKRFLDDCGYRWEETQTTAPVNVTASSLPSNRIRLNWQACPYVDNGGCYRIYYAVKPGGPYTQVGKTADKQATSFDVTGLTAGTAYYFVVRTQTDAHADNVNAVISDWSVETSSR